MDNELNLELRRFDEVEAVIDAQLIAAARESAKLEFELTELQKDVTDDVANALDKDERMMEIAQYLTPLARGSLSAEASLKREEQLLSARQNPYFARIDFKRSDSDRPVRTHYIGRFSVRGENVRDMYVFDWRAPVSSLFYRYGVGYASYEAPAGTIEGEITLKRQYEIKNAKFEYYFDSDVQIVDEYLRKMLSQNTSDKMKTIVETIQRDQDEVIRDARSDLLMVQGAAGSGKTSIALHRAAYLMYEGLSNQLSAHNIAVLSPNKLFEKYISSVLPELGEKSVVSFVFGDLINTVLGGNIEVESKFAETESAIIGEADVSDIDYKSSAEFAERIKNFASGVKPEFRGVEYCGKTVYSALDLDEMFAKSDDNAPLAMRLDKLERQIMDKVHKLRPARLKELEAEANLLPEHAMEVKEYARMLSISESTELITRVREFTRLDYVALYFEMLGEPIPQPPLRYRDAVGITLLKLMLEPRRIGNSESVQTSGIKQVVVDEAQDYDAAHFEILKRLFPAVRYTVLGDVSQTVGKPADMTLYARIQDTLNVKNPYLATLSRSFRSTKEILEFSSGIVGQEIENFGRSGDAPTVKVCSAESEYLDALVDEIETCLTAGYASVALICKSERASRELYGKLKDLAEVRLMVSGASYNTRGVFIVPVYMAKGLEFDATLVCGAEEYATDRDANLLYIACTRALHRLNLFCLGQTCELLS
ncbi:MAG: AAA family ATPase [Oscillospiraceae bacterium]|nr:AAA family ATPase [Oscillospiraceae bacterium]